MIQSDSVVQVIVKKKIRSGEQGLDGVPGARGRDGPAGPRGESGFKGDRGKDGGDQNSIILLPQNLDILGLVFAGTPGDAGHKGEIVKRVRLSLIEPL